MVVALTCNRPHGDIDLMRVRIHVVPSLSESCQLCQFKTRAAAVFKIQRLYSVDSHLPHRYLAAFPAMSLAPVAPFNGSRFNVSPVAP